ncbi:MAG: hypothetical protein LBL84_03535 [Candidatus Nomurabacteria bacterium]|jgi:signal transduction histidine kinase|nr:hypothetical protein [Candidatus Nomurabacteria bacterium]
MMWVEQSVLLVAVVVAVFVSFSVLLQRGNFFRRLMFFISNMACAVWAAGIAIFITATDPTVLSNAAKVYYVAAAVLIWATLSMVCVFFRARKGAVWVSVLTALPLVYIISTILWRPTSLITSVSVGEYNTAELDPVGYLVYSIYFTLYSLAALYILYMDAKTAREAASRRQIKHILITFVIDFIVGATFNLYLPWLGIYSLIWVGPINIILLALMLYWAIIRYGLFGLKDLAVKFFSYAVFIVVVAVCYSLIFGVLAEHVFGLTDSISWGMHAVNVAMMAVIVVCLPIINRLNRYLDDLFHPNGYRIDTIISKLNRAIIKNHDTSQLLISSARLVNKALSTRFVSFVIMRHPQHILVAGSPRRAFTDDEARKVAKLVESTDSRIIFADTLSEGNDALAVMRYHHIAMVVQIRYQSDTEDGDTVGYMMVSNKVKNRSFVQRDIDLLTATSGLMALAIENASYYQQVRSFNENLKQEVAVATSRLRNSNRKLHKLDEAKDEFLSMASHQLRTPLTSIKGYLSMVLEGDAGKISAVQRHFLTEAYQSSNNMVRIIEDLLSVSRIQTGKFVLDKTDVDIAKVVQDEAGAMVDSVMARGLKIAVNIAEGDYTTSGDELKLHQITGNLIDNALYYSNSGGLIAVGLSHEGNRIVFKVTDSGIGVPKEEVSSLFTKFQRASNAKKRRPDGTGVGLFLVKRVAKAHGGDVFVESQEGKGSTFGFWIPK